MKKLAIIRTASTQLNTNSYNIQEIGLAKGLFNCEVSTDIYSRFYDIKNPTTLLQRNNSIIQLIPIKGITIANRLTWFSEIKKYISKNEYDVIQVHEDSQLMTPYILKKAKKRKIRTVLMQGMYEDYKGYKRVLQKIYDFMFKKIIRNNTDIIIAKTNKAKEYLLKKGYDSPVIIPVGLDISIKHKKTSFLSELIAFKKKVHKIILYVGIIESRRNVSFIIEILDHFHKINSKIGLILIGKGPQVPKIRKIISRYNLDEYVKFIDQLPNNELKDIYKLANVFLLPSLHEIYGMVVLEALYFGIPVISSRTAGPLDILIKKELGCCLELDKIIWVKEILNYINMENNNTKRTDYIRENYNWRKIGIQYYNLCFY